MKYLWSTYVQLMWLEVLQLLTFFRLQLWRGLTPPYEWMALRWLFVATSAPVLDCAFVSIGEYVFRKPDVSCFKEIYTQLRYSNPKCREDESKAKVHGSKSLTSLVMGEGGGKAKLSKLPSQASKRRNKATFWSCWAEDHQGIGIHLTTSHDHGRSQWSQWSCLCMNQGMLMSNAIQHYNILLDCALHKSLLLITKL